MLPELFLHNKRIQKGNEKYKRKKARASRRQSSKVKLDAKDEDREYPKFK